MGETDSWGIVLGLVSRGQSHLRLVDRRVVHELLETAVGHDRSGSDAGDRCKSFVRDAGSDLMHHCVGGCGICALLLSAPLTLSARVRVIGIMRMTLLRPEVLDYVNEIG